jgi:hypothetical protein
MTPELEYNRGCRKQRTLVNDTPEARIAFLRRLRAVRQFRPDPLPDAVLHDVLGRLGCARLNGVVKFVRQLLGVEHGRWKRRRGCR